MTHDPDLRLLVLKSNKVEDLRIFYQQLGFRFVKEQHGNGPVHYSASLGDGIIEIYPLPNDSLPDSSTRLGFAVANLIDLVDELVTTAEVVSKPKETPWGVRAIVRDPDGRTIELYETVTANG